MNSNAPFCDIKSWAGVLYNEMGSTTDWEECLKTLGLTKESVLGFEDISLYTSLYVANANIPVTHVCGDSDKVVP